MDKEKIASAVAEAQSKQRGAASKEERRRARLLGAAAAANRVAITDDANGTTIEIASLSFRQQLRCMESDMIWMGLLFSGFIIVPGAFVGIPLIPSMPWLGAILGAVALIGLAALVWYLRAALAKPLVFQLTPDGHAALWRNRAPSRKPTWVGAPGTFRLHVDKFGPMHNKTGSPERRYGWSYLMVDPDDHGAIDAGLKYYLNWEDTEKVRAVLEPRGILWA